MLEEFKDIKELQMMAFKMGNENYALPLTCVQEIIMPQKPTSIPKAPDWIEGVLNLRGHIIPIVDGNKKFSLVDEFSNKADKRIIVLDIEPETLGLIVDEVSEVVHLQTEDIEPIPVELCSNADFLSGIAKCQNRLLILINPKKFLSQEETKDIKKLSKTK